MDKTNILPYIDIFKTDAVEAEAITGESNIEKAAQRLADWGAKEIILTHRNGLLVLSKGVYYKAEFHSKDLVGRNGRGDTCLAAYACKRLMAKTKEATIWAATVTRLKMEAERPIKRTIKAVQDLFEKRYPT